MLPNTTSITTTTTTTTQPVEQQPPEPPPQDLEQQQPQLINPVPVVPEDNHNAVLESNDDGTTNQNCIAKLKNASKRTLILLVIMVLTVTSAIVVGTVCGLTDTCSRRSTPLTRAQVLTMYVNDMVTLAQRPITVPSSSSSSSSIGLSVHGEDWALSWLIDQDPLQLWPNDSLSSQFRFTQRYALLSLWYQQQIVNDEWYNRSGWLQVENECEWYGILCTKVTDVGNVVSHIRLPGNNLRGTLTPELGLLDSMIHFNISNNSPQGVIPTTLKRWTDLESFDSGVTVEDEFLCCELSIFDMELTFSSWNKLRFFSWSSPFNNAGSSPRPSEFGHWWPRMEHFDVKYSYETGTLPNSMALWTNLTSFTIGAGIFNGAIPEFVGEWTRLRNLDISRCHFSGTIPSAVGKWTNIVHVNMADNRLSGTLPESVGRWTAIQSLRLGTKIGGYYGDWTLTGSLDASMNMFNGSLPDAIGNWTDILHVDLSSNLFTGSLLPQIGHWSNVRYVYMDSNEFSGTLPSSIGNWKSRDVYLRANNLEGTVPDAVRQWTDLTSLDLSDNQFSGSISPFVGNWTSLSTLFLSNNSFTGTLPTTIGQCTYMTYFAIDNNRFSGTIPQALAQWRDLLKGNMSANELSGSVPNELCSLQREAEFELYADCNSEVTCQCCIICT